MNYKQHLLNKFPNLYPRFAIVAVAIKEEWGRLFLREKALEKYKDIHKGDRCFIVATGPSLKLEDVERLKGEYTFGVNSIVNLFPKTNWRPTYYCLGDPDVYEGVKKQLKLEAPSHSFFARGFVPAELPFGEWYRPRMLEFKLRKLPAAKHAPYAWSNDISKEIASGETIVYSAMQIAAYMGFEKIYLLGTDCNYTNPDAAHGELLSYKYDKLRPLNLGDQMMANYRYAKMQLEKRNIKVYNATRGGMLEVFPRVNLNEVLSEEKRSYESH